MENAKMTTVPSPDDLRIMKTELTMRVPLDSRKEPIISQLIMKHGITVNITAAVLGESSEGWFNLELTGTQGQIQSALIFLEEMNLEVWQRHDREEESW